MMEADQTVIEAGGQPVRGGLPLLSIPGFEVLRLLGQGGMGQVFEARQLRLHRHVALKLVASAHDEAVLARFEEEIQAVASLRHPNIAQIYESGHIDARPFYAMELVTGGTLNDRLKAGPLPTRDAAELLVLLAQAMQHAHDKNILHRDLKPSNILLDNQTSDTTLTPWNPKITDFGLAKRLDSESKLTRTGDIFGSPSYMAPEQASGVMKLTTAVDIYALGAVLYECLTGRPPFLGPDPMQTVMLVLSSDPLPPRQLQPKLPADLNTICMKCLEKSPKKRYATAQTLADDLERYLRGEPILARPVGNLERLQKWAMRRPWQAAALGLAVALFLGLFVGMLFLQMAYRATRVANEEANKAFGLSRNTLTKILDKLSGDLATLPNSEKIALDSYQPAVQLFRELHSLRPDDRSTSLDYFQQLQSYATRLALSRHMDDARALFQETEQLVQTELTKKPDDLDWRLAEVRFYINRGWFSRQEGKRDKAIPDETKAQTLLHSLKKDHPTEVRLIDQSIDLLKSSIADTIAQSQRATTSREKKQLVDEVVKKYREVMDESQRRYDLQPTPDHAVLLLNAEKGLATILTAVNSTDEAEQLYHSIASTLPKLKLDEQYRLSFQVQMDIDRGELARRRSDFTTANKFFHQARQGNKQLRDRYYEVAGNRYDWFNLRSKAAQLLHDEGKLSAAITELKLCLNDMDADLQKHPDEPSIADLRKAVVALLAHYESESRTPPGK